MSISVRIMDKEKDFGKKKRVQRRKETEKSQTLWLLILEPQGQRWIVSD
tara:strand:+ start:239 stop:385 length:147 start_codon:yes stop_codon:yes gene_type:complete